MTRNTLRTIGSNIREQLNLLRELAAAIDSLETAAAKEPEGSDHQKFLLAKSAELGKIVSKLAENSSETGEIVLSA